jgi:hypothetical protein
MSSKRNNSATSSISEKKGKFLLKNLSPEPPRTQAPLAPRSPKKAHEGALKK